MRPLALLLFMAFSALKFVAFIAIKGYRCICKILRAFGLIVCVLYFSGESGFGYKGLFSNPQEQVELSLRSLWSQSVTLRRIKDIDCWQFNTKIGKVILTDYKWENHIQIRHPFVTTEAIRKALEHPRVMYKSNKRWIFEKDNLRVVVGNDKVITAYYMDGR